MLKRTLDKIRQIGWRPRRPILIAVIIILAVGILGGFFVYRRPDSSAAQRLASFMPYPAAVAGFKIVWASEIYSQARYMKHYSQKTNQVIPEGAELRGQILDHLIEVRLVEREAARYKLDVTKKEVDEAMEAIAAENGGREKLQATLKDLYSMTERQFRKLVADQLIVDKFKREVLVTVSVRHILVKDQKKAADLARQAREGSDFAELAKQFSEDTGSRDAGGSLGFIARGQTTKPFEDMAFSLQVGQISDPVQTQFGWHVIKVEEKKGTVDKSYADWLSEKKNQTKTWKLLVR